MAQKKAKKKDIKKTKKALQTQKLGENKTL